MKERAAIAQYGDLVSRHPWEVARAKFAISLLKRWSPLVGPVLDVGCGDAYVLSQIRNELPGHGWYGVDSNYHGQEATGLTLCASLDDLPKEASPAGVIVLMDVLEHVQDPVKLLTELRNRRIVNAETLFLVTVPAWQILFTNHDRWLGHYRRYDKVLLRAHLEESGIQVLESGYVFFSLMLVRATEVLLARLGISTASETGLVRWRGKSLLSRLLSWLLLLDAVFCQKISQTTGISPPGLSCFAVGRLR